MNLDSIRNFKFQPNKGSIVIDKPDEDDWHFHYKLPCVSLKNQRKARKIFLFR